MKSPFFTDLENNISRVNNNMCFYLFLHAEVEDTICKIEDKHNVYLDEFFKNNSYGKMNHIKLDEVGVLFEGQKKDYLSSVFMKIYMYMDYYLEELIDYVVSINSINMVKSKSDSQFDYLIGILGNKNALDEVIILSFDYMRLRRNRLIHDDGETSARIRATYKNKQCILGKYWNEYIRDSFPIFKVENLDTFEKDELIFYLIVARRICKHIDSAVMSVINKYELYKYEFSKKFNNRKMYSRKVLIRKSRRFLGDLLGEQPTEEMIVKILDEEI